jgi:benzoate membrane transport protein
MRFSVVAAALVAVLVGFGGTLAIIVAAARNLGAGPAEVASWVGALCLGIGISSLVLSWRTRVPVVTAWSLAGAVLIAGLPPGPSMAQAVGAFLLSGLLMLLAGLVPALGAAVSRLPAPVGAAMLAGLLLRFVLALFQSAQVEPLLVLPLLALFLAARAVHAASAPLIVLLAGLPLAALLGHAMPPLAFGLALPVWTTPEFAPAAMLGLGLPLFLVTMATQQIPGAAVLRVAGYASPTRLALGITGGLTLLLAPFGGYSVNLSSITAAICTGPDAHPDPGQRWKTGPIYGACYLVLALFGAGFATMLAGLPPILVGVVAGTALLGPLTNALSAAISVADQRFAAITAFTVTASGLSALGLGSAFWGLLAGVVVLGAERLTRR